MKWNVSGVVCAWSSLMNVIQISLFELGFSKETKPSCGLTKTFGKLADAKRKQNFCWYVYKRCYKEGGEIAKSYHQNNFWFVGWDFPASVTTSWASMKTFFKEIDLVFHFINTEGDFLPLAYRWNFFLCFVTSS